eukprot:1180005-Alexandrium_andersonii.AAC.1
MRGRVGRARAANDERRTQENCTRGMTHGPLPSATIAPLAMTLRHRSPRPAAPGVRSARWPQPHAQRPDAQPICPALIGLGPIGEQPR